MQDRRAESLAHHPFPRIQLEKRHDWALVEIDKPAAFTIPTDIFDRNPAGVDASLHRGIHQVLQVAPVFDAVAHAGEVNGFGAREGGAKRSPASYQLFVKR